MATTQPAGGTDTRTESPRKHAVAIAASTAVIVALGVGFTVGRAAGEGEWVTEYGEPFTARVDAYQPKSICLTADGASSGTCAVPLVHDPARVRVGSRVRVVELLLQDGTNAFYVLQPQ